MGTVTIRELDKGAYRTLKAEASRRGMKVGEAASEAFREWTKSKRVSRAIDKLAMRNAIKHMDSTRTPSGKWSAVEEIRRWREYHQK